MSEIILVLEGRVLPGKQRELESFLREARPFYESIGDVFMRFMWDAREDGRFREIFEYGSRKAFDADDYRVNHDPVMQKYLARWRTLLDGEIEVSVWHNVDIWRETVHRAGSAE